MVKKYTSSKKTSTIDHLKRLKRLKFLRKGTLMSSSNTCISS